MPNLTAAWTKQRQQASCHRGRELSKISDIKTKVKGKRGIPTVPTFSCSIQKSYRSGYTVLLNEGKCGVQILEAVSGAAEVPGEFQRITSVDAWAVLPCRRLPNGYKEDRNNM
jgi:hypothetical protein